MSLRIKLLATLLALAPALQAAEPVRAVERVDLRRYAGTWYEQAHLPLFFQRDCARDTTATELFPTRHADQKLARRPRL